MKTIGFIGAVDKSDLIAYVARILQILGYKVLVIDTTSTQKLKYIIPTIKPTKSYITSFEEIDFGIGFENWEEIEKYLGIRFKTNDESQNETQTQPQIVNENLAAKEVIEDKKDTYDYILIDIDSKDGLEKFNVTSAEKKYFFTKFDKYCLNKGMEIFAGLEETIDLTKVLFSYTSCSKEDEEYLDFISSYYQINWNEYELYFKIQGEDNQTFEENQRLQKIRFRRLGQNFKDSLAYLIQDIRKTDSMGTIKKAMKD